MITTVFENSDCKWVDVVYPNAEELQQIAEIYSIHSTAIQDCLDPEHLPKYEKIDNVVFMITRAYDSDAPTSANNVWDLTRKIAIFLGDNFLITVHRIDQSYLTIVRDKWLKQKVVTGNAGFQILSELLQTVLESYEKPLKQAEDTLDEFEHTIFLYTTSVISFRELYLLRRKISVYQRMVHLTAAVLLKINNLSDKQAPFMQNLHEDLGRLQFIVDQLSEGVNHLLTLHVSLESFRTNEVMRVLTLFSVFFMPLTFIVGIYGMNFEFMPELKIWYAYPLVLLAMVGVTIALYLWFRRKGLL